MSRCNDSGGVQQWQQPRRGDEPLTREREEVERREHRRVEPVSGTCSTALAADANVFMSSRSIKREGRVNHVVESSHSCDPFLSLSFGPRIPGGLDALH